MQDQVGARLAARAAQLCEQMDALRAPEGELTRAALARCLGESEPIVVGQLTARTAHAALQEQLEQVRHAQRRLDEGRYGECEECGRQIPGERLAVRPWSTRCVRHG